MPDYTVTTNPSEEEALQWVAGQANEDAEIYFDARMHEVLADYVKQHAVQNAVAPVDDVAIAYASGTPEQQSQVAGILGVETSKPA
jgi:hypothetical protein